MNNYPIRFFVSFASSLPLLPFYGSRLSHVLFSRTDSGNAVPNIIKHTLPGEPEKEAKRDFHELQIFSIAGKRKRKCKNGKSELHGEYLSMAWRTGRLRQRKKTIHPIAIHSDYLSCVNYYDDMIQIMLGYHVPVQYF